MIDFSHTSDLCKLPPPPHSGWCSCARLFSAEDVVRAGDCSLPWEPELVSPCFIFYSIGQGRVIFWFLGVVLGFCLVCFGFHCLWPFPFRSPCPTMTILAQLNDCHSWNDARSIVQKKKVEAVMWMKGRSMVLSVGWRTPTSILLKVLSLTLEIGFTQSMENIYEVSDETSPKLKNSSELQIQNLIKSLISRLIRMS